MSDITERLRGRIGPLMYQHDNGIDITLEAADEIDHLRDALKPFADAYELGGKTDVWSAAYLNNNAWKLAYDVTRPGDTND